MKCALVTLGDENYLEQVKQFFSSVYYSQAWDGDCIFLAHNVPKEKTKWFSDRGIIVFDCKPLVSGTPGGMSASLISKFYLFSKAFRKYDVVIYSDADTIVNGNLNYLKEVTSFASVEDSTFTLRWQIIKLREIIKRKQDILKTCYKIEEVKKKYFTHQRQAFCAGFFAFRPKKIPPNMDARLMELLQKYEAVSQYGEQLIFNMAFYNAWIQLPQTYNVHVNYVKKFYKMPDEMVKGIVLHFIGSEKPWLTKTAYSDLWHSNYAKADKISMKKLKLKQSWSKKEINDYAMLLKRFKIEAMRKQRKNKVTFIMQQYALRLKDKIPQWYIEVSEKRKKVQKKSHK